MMVTTGARGTSNSGRVRHVRQIDELFLDIQRPLDLEFAALFQREEDGQVRIERGINVGGPHVQAVGLDQLEQHVAGLRADRFGQRANGYRQENRNAAFARLGDFLFLELVLEAARPRPFVEQHINAAARKLVLDFLRASLAFGCLFCCVLLGCCLRPLTLPGRSLLPPFLLASPSSSSSTGTTALPAALPGRSRSSGRSGRSPIFSSCSLVKVLSGCMIFSGFFSGGLAGRRARSVLGGAIVPGRGTGRLLPGRGVRARSCRLLRLASRCQGPAPSSWGAPVGLPVEFCPRPHWAALPMALAQRMEVARAEPAATPPVVSVGSPARQLLGCDGARQGPRRRHGWLGRQCGGRGSCRFNWLRRHRHH